MGNYSSSSILRTVDPKVFNLKFVFRIFKIEEIISLGFLLKPTSVNFFKSFLFKFFIASDSPNDPHNQTMSTA